jgi:hypothetical protein
MKSGQPLTVAHREHLENPANRANLPNPENMTPAATAIIQSVLFAGLFDYPLTLAQLRQTLIASAQTPTQILATWEHSLALKAAIDRRDGFFFPRGREALVAERRVREARSHQFLRHHRRLLSLVCALPYVKMAALSGSIAHLNLEGNGDLDLFIITKGRHVWSVTVGVVLLAKLLRRRRTVCANFVISDAALALDQQDLFTASQIIHLKPLVGGDVYSRFIAANPFVTRFYPNFHASHNRGLTLPGNRLRDRVKACVEYVCWGPSAAVEWFCRRAYSAYLLRKAGTWQSPEQVRLEPECLKLHTQSHRQSVLTRFEEAIHGLGA